MAPLIVPLGSPLGLLWLEEAWCLSQTGRSAALPLSPLARPLSSPHGAGGLSLKNDFQKQNSGETRSAPAPVLAHYLCDFTQENVEKHLFTDPDRRRKGSHQSPR